MDGYLGIADFEILMYKRTNDYQNINRAMDIFRNVKSNIVELGKDKDLCFPTEIGGRIASPYIKDGLAGFVYIGLELYLCGDFSKEVKEDLKKNIILPAVDALRKEKWTQYPGFLDGLSGIAYMLFKAGKVFSKKDLIDEAISILLNVETFTLDIDGCSYTPNNNFQNLTFDLESGNAGIVYVQKEVLNYINNGVLT
nr:lanthionine synthetase LanC family protein [Bacillus fungorum]